ncbi:MAG TPA: PQQ-binding-like beta-propeller repeat protein [Alphaproteobacteria bacterium]|nr:PQQ-binding-like beta-propeller repeat protein [Alphaproteobacteria bacterium]
MNKLWGLVLATLALAGCDAKKIPITGTRVPVVSYETTVKVDDETKSTIIALPISEIGRDWPQCGSGAEHAMPHLSLNDNLEPHWSVSIGSGNGAGRFLSSPIVSEGEVYALDTYGTVTAFHAASGESFWETNISPEGRNDPIIGGGLAYGGGKIFVTSPHAEVLALDAKTGKILWRHSTQSPIRAAPTYADGRLFILGINNHLQVLDAEKGVRLWDHAGITEYAGLLGTASPAVSKGIVIVTYSSGEIYALKCDNGHQLWTETLSSTRRPDSLSALSHIRALPVIDDNKVIIIGHNQKMAAYDLRRGERLWERNIGGTRTPAVVGGYVFMINSHNELLCITRDYGQVVWVRKLESDPESPYKVIWEGPLVAGNKLYLVSTSGALLALDPASGNTLSERQLNSSLSLAPFVAQETLYVLSDRGELMTFR